jgi:hypothetical protein
VAYGTWYEDQEIKGDLVYILWLDPAPLKMIFHNDMDTAMRQMLSTITHRKYLYSLSRVNHTWGVLIAGIKFHEFLKYLIQQYPQINEIDELLIYFKDVPLDKNVFFNFGPEITMNGETHILECECELCGDSAVMKVAAPLGDNLEEQIAQLLWINKYEGV